jgi:hypothetical protein
MGKCMPCNINNKGDTYKEWNRDKTVMGRSLDLEGQSACRRQGSALSLRTKKKTSERPNGNTPVVFTKV